MTHHGGEFGWEGCNIYETSLAGMESAVRSIAAEKNVEVTDDAVAYITEQAAEALELADHHGLLHRDLAAHVRAAIAIDRAIDRHYLLGVGIHIAGLFGMPEAAASFAPAFAAGAIAVFHGAAGTTNRHAWPPPMQFAADVVLTGPYATLTWKNSDGGTETWRARFWADSSAPGPGSSASSFRPSRPLEGEMHRPSQEGPAVEKADAAGLPVLQVYMEHGKPHRDPAEGPAVFRRVGENGGVVFVREYWVDGVLHRPSQEGPAVIETDGNGRALVEIYIERRKRHRDPAHGPAFFKIEEIDGEQRRVFEYWQHGELHRASTDGPAAWETDMEGRICLEVYLEHGRRHRDAAEGPALFRLNKDSGQPRLQYGYFREGELHRDPCEGPALIERDPLTGAILREEFYRNGVLHRDEQQGPAVIERYNASAPLPCYESYHANGEFHRSNGPATLTRCPQTGAVTGEWHHAHGQLHRDDGPAIVLRQPDGTVFFEAWYRDGELIEERGDPSGGLDSPYQPLPEIPTA
jgi:hypothetical protein